MASEIIKALNWRYATKTFSKDRKLSQEQVDRILDAARLSPSAFGLQPWKFILVTNPETRTKLRDAAWNQAQVAEASHLIVFASVKGLDAAYVDRFVEATAKTRGIPVDVLKDSAGMMKGAVTSRTPEQVNEWSARQTYISVGVAITAAAVEGIDAGPMEGFDPQKVDEILGLDKLGLQSVVMLALGYRASEEEVQKYKKVRFAKEEVVIEVK
jgi:nitroreductase